MQNTTLRGMCAVVSCVLQSTVQCFGVPVNGTAHKADLACNTTMHKCKRALKSKFAIMYKSRHLPRKIEMSVLDGVDLKNANILTVCSSQLPDILYAVTGLAGLFVFSLYTSADAYDFL